MTTMVKRERVIAERDGSGWLVMWPDGRVEGFTTKRAVLAAIKARAKSVDIHVAEVEWRS